MVDVFISYKREDRECVRGLVHALQERGFTVWWDNRLEWGDNWMRCIKRALDAATCVVVVWTPKSVTSEGNYRSDVVAAEASAAHSRHALLPVRIGEVSRPFPHNILQEENLSNWPGNADDAVFLRIAARLETLCGARTLPEADEIAAWLKAEDIDNAEAFREFAREFPGSRYASEAEPRAAECDIRSADVALARDAAKGMVERFSKEVRKPELTPPLGLQKVARQISPFSRPELFADLKGGAKVVLQAAPGGGKSTALLDLARAYSNSGAESIGAYLRLKDLFNQGDDIRSHLERLEVDKLISESAWHELARSGCLTVFCDGCERASGTLRYQFQHQLISEWYGAQEVRRLAALALWDDPALAALDQLINRRVWTEALLFAAEKPEGDDGDDATAFMILRASGGAPFAITRSTCEYVQSQSPRHCLSSMSSWWWS